MKKYLMLTAMLLSGIATAQVAVAPPAVSVNPFAGRPIPPPAVAFAPGQPLAVPDILPAEAVKQYQDSFDSKQGVRGLQLMVKVVGIGPDFAMLRMIEGGTALQSVVVREGESILLPDGKPYTVKFKGKTLNESRVQFYFSKALVYESDVAAPSARRMTGAAMGSSGLQATTTAP